MRKTLFRKTIILVAFVLMGRFCQAQTWDDLTYWFKYGEGKEYLAGYAHPVLDVTDVTFVEINSNNIIVDIGFEGSRRSFTSTYRIVRGTFKGEPYFKTVIVLADDFMKTSFETWSRLPRFYSLVYDEVEASELYGASSYENLSLGQQAAFSLMVEFAKEYDEY